MPPGCDQRHNARKSVDLPGIAAACRTAANPHHGRLHDRDEVCKILDFPAIMQMYQLFDWRDCRGCGCGAMARRLDDAFALLRRFAAPLHIYGLLPAGFGR
jgi:hypothetical protein